MSQWDKLLADIMAKDQNLRFDALYKAMVRMGYTPEEPGGGSSHYTFRKAGHMPVTLPKHGAIKKVYVSLVSEAVKAYLKEEAQKDE